MKILITIALFSKLLFASGNQNYQKISQDQEAAREQSVKEYKSWCLKQDREFDEAKVKCLPLKKDKEIKKDVKRHTIKNR